MIHTYPFYAVTPRFEVLEWTGTASAEHTTFYGEPLEVPRMIGAGTSRDAAVAVLRVCGVEEFLDWTVNGASWDSPLTKVENPIRPVPSLPPVEGPSVGVLVEA